MEQQDELKIAIGNEEAVTLRPANVKVLSVRIEEIAKAKSGKKVICEVKHQDSDIPINISAVKFEQKGNLTTAGLWINKDSKGLIRKGSALAVFLNSVGAKTIEQLKDKEIPTTPDNKGYLVFKAY